MDTGTVGEQYESGGNKFIGHKAVGLRSFYRVDEFQALKCSLHLVSKKGPLKVSEQECDNVVL